MEQWIAALKSWWKWLLGDEPRPSGRSGLVVGITAAVLVVLGLVVGQVLAGSQDKTDVTGGGTTPATETTVIPAGGHVAEAPYTSPDTTSPPTDPGTPSGDDTDTTGPSAALRGVSSQPAAPPRTADGPTGGSATAIPAVLTPPTGVTVVQGKGWAALRWVATSEPAATVLGYNVYVGSRPGAESTTPANGTSPIEGTSDTVTHLRIGATYYFTVRAATTVGLSPPSEGASTPEPAGPESGTLAGPVVGMASPPSGSGYWLVDAKGEVSTHGGVVQYGSAAGLNLASPIVQIVSTPDGRGYWEVASDGGVFAFGDAGFFGSMGGKSLNGPVVAMVPTSDGQGYWLVGVDGGVFSFGDASFLGSMGGRPLAAPVVDIAADPATGGYWEVASNGEVYGFDAPSFGSSAGRPLNGPVIAMAATHDGQGYWLVATDGGVFCYGDAPFSGSLATSALNAPIVGISPDLADDGYWLVAADGGVFSYSAPFMGAD